MSGHCLMLTYGCWDYTRACLDDLLQLEGKPQILVIVNKHPEDDPTLDNLEPYVIAEPRLTVWPMQENLGVAGGWNLGLHHLFNLGADEVLVTGNDARLRPDTYRRLAAEEGGCLFTAWTATLAEMQRDIVGFPLPLPPQWNGEPDIGPAHLMRKWLYNAVGPYDEGFWPIYYEDVDWFYRVRLLGLRDAYRTIGVPCYHSDGGSRWYKVSQAADDAHHAPFLKCQERYLLKWGGLPPDEKFTIPFNGEEEG